MVDVLQKLHARAGEPSTNLLYETHPHPRDRLTKVGEILEPQMASLPPGDEPPLKVSARSLPRPMAGSGRVAPAGARSMASEKAAAPANEQQSEIPSSFLDTVRNPRSGNAIPGAAEGLLRGILGR